MSYDSGDGYGSPMPQGGVSPQGQQGQQGQFQGQPQGQPAPQPSPNYGGYGAPQPGFQSAGTPPLYPAGYAQSGMPAYGGFAGQHPVGQGVPPMDPPTPEPKDTVEPKDPAEVVAPTGLFNTELPTELQGNVAIEGLFALARANHPELDLNRVVGRAWESGDPSHLDVAYLAEVVGEEHAKYYSEYFGGLVSSYVESTHEQLNAWARDIYDKYGGNEGWGRIVDTFKGNATPELVNHVVSLLDSPDEATRNIGVDMITNFVSPYGVIPQRGREVAPGTGAVPAQGASALSAAQYKEEIAALYRSGQFTPQAVAELDNRRAMGARLGL